MSTENENENLDTTTEVSESHSEPVKSEPKLEPRFAREEKSDKSIKSLLKESMAKVKEEDDPLPLTSKERKAVKEKVEPDAPKEKTAKTEFSTPAPKAEVENKNPKESKTEETVPPEAPQASGIPAPAALTKEEKELWETLPAVMQNAFLRRESDTQKGIEKLKAQYRPIEDALAPIRPLLAQRGLTEGHAVKQLFDWHVALASPNRGSQVAAFRALAQSHGVDLNLLAPPPSPQQYQQPVVQQQPAQQENVAQDPFAQIQPYLEQTIQPIRQQLSAYEQQLQNQRLESANKELATFSADKPHFEKVRYRMAEILSTASQFGRPVTLQEAYDEAVWGMSELRDQIIQDQEAKRQAEFEAKQAELQKKLQEDYLAKAKQAEEELAKKRELEALEKAKRANVSPRSTTPVGVVSTKGPRKPTSVADSIRATMKELSSSI